MSTDARIDELRNKFEESPRRYFAPLANELRKAGRLEEAVALCRAFLPKQPEHMSGYIVFGQALYESGELSEARTVFEHALALDPENLKALRFLGDIASGEGDTAAARRWYERVLEADPRNDDIAVQLATLRAPSPTPSLSPVLPVDRMAAGAAPSPAAIAWAVAEREREVVTSLTLPTEEPSEADRSEPTRDSQGSEEASDLFGFSDDVSEAVIADAEGFEEGLIAPEWPDTSDLVARMAAPRRAATPATAVGAPDALAAFGVEQGDPEPARVHAELPRLEPVRDGELPNDEPTYDVRQTEETDPAFVTETMGELLAAQGFTARAVAVYEELVRRRSYDPMLTSRLAELQSQLAEESALPAAAADRAALPAHDQPLPATEPIAALAETANEPVTAREVFARLAARRVLLRAPSFPTPAASTSPEGLAALFGSDAPTHEDLAARMLADAFVPADQANGVDGDRSFEAAMLGGVTQMPASPGERSPASMATASDGSDEAFSFSQFFPQSPTVTSSGPAPASPTSIENHPASSSAPAEAPPTVRDDLEQFSAWLKGLGAP